VGFWVSINKRGQVITIQFLKTDRYTVKFQEKKVADLGKMILIIGK
jgi:hypothetical protein